MKFISVINGKGGPGKTTFSMLLAVVLAKVGKRVAVKDTDPQRTSTRMMNEISQGEDGLELFVPGKEYDFVIIDTPPAIDGDEVGAAIKEGDVIVLVSSPSPFDLFTSKDTVDKLAERNATKKAVMLVNKVRPGTILTRDFDELAKSFGIPVLKNRLQDRQEYQRVALFGWKHLSVQAREELSAIAMEILAHD